MKTRAFTLVEIMIVIVIIGLMASIIIPIFASISDDTIIDRARSGDILTDSEKQHYREAIARKRIRETQKILDNRNLESGEKATKLRVTQEYNENNSFQKISINGNLYFLVPCYNDMKITEIAGEKFWLVPEKR